MSRKRRQAKPRADDDVRVHVIMPAKDHGDAVKALKDGGGMPLGPYMRIALREKLRRDGLLKD